MRPVAAFLLALCLTAPAAAFAQGGAQGGRLRDGRIAPTAGLGSSRPAQLAFRRLDPQGKGWVDEGEFLRARPLARRIFAALDRNGDGVIDRAEFLGARGGAERAALFRRLDRRNNGRLTPDELSRGWSPALFQALSGGRGTLTAADLRPGLPAAAPPQQAGLPVGEEAAPAGPARPVPCWIPLAREGRFAMLFPDQGPACR